MLKIIIVNYNSRLWIEKCLKSIEKYIEDVIIIDNSSNDDSINLIKSFNENIKIFTLKENIGFGGANNIGIKYAIEQGAEYVFLMNQDVYIQENTIETLIDISKKNKDYGIISPIHLNGDGSKLDYNFSLYISPFECQNFISDAILNCIENKLYDVNFVNAAFWLITKKCVETVGGFNPIFFHYGEDNNYCHRVLFHNLKIGIYPKSYIQHDREFRKLSNYHSDDERINRMIKLKYSDPNLKLTSYNFYKEIVRNILELLVSFNLKKVYTYFKLFRLNINNIQLHKKISIKLNAFLNINER